MASNNERVGAYAPLFFLVSFCVCGIILLALSVNLSKKLDTCGCDSQPTVWGNRVVFILGMIITTATIISIFYNIGGIQKGVEIKSVANFYRDYGIILGIVGLFTTAAGITMIVDTNAAKSQSPGPAPVTPGCPKGPCNSGTLGLMIAITAFGVITTIISGIMVYFNEKTKGGTAKTLKSSGVANLLKEGAEKVSNKANAALLPEKCSGKNVVTIPKVTVDGGGIEVKGDPITNPNHTNLSYAKSIYKVGMCREGYKCFNTKTMNCENTKGELDPETFYVPEIGSKGDGAILKELKADLSRAGIGALAEKIPLTKNKLMKNGAKDARRLVNEAITALEAVGENAVKKQLEMKRKIIKDKIKAISDEAKATGRLAKSRKELADRDKEYAILKQRLANLKDESTKAETTEVLPETTEVLPETPGVKRVDTEGLRRMPETPQTAPQTI